MTVLQEQSSLLYIIAGLLLVLNVISLGIWLRLGEREKTAPPPRRSPAESARPDRSPIGKLRQGQ